jgi:hypothetical protein
MNYTKLTLIEFLALYILPAVISIVFHANMFICYVVIWGIITVYTMNRQGIIK